MKGPMHKRICINHQKDIFFGILHHKPSVPNPWEISYQLSKNLHFLDITSKNMTQKSFAFLRVIRSREMQLLESGK